MIIWTMTGIIQAIFLGIFVTIVSLIFIGYLIAFVILIIKEIIKSIRK